MDLGPSVSESPEWNWLNVLSCSIVHDAVLFYIQDSHNEEGWQALTSEQVSTISKIQENKNIIIIVIIIMRREGKINAG